MHSPPSFDSQLLQPLGGTTTRARPGVDNTAQPSLTSGFGAVMEQEGNIQSATERGLGTDKGPNSAAIDRVLRNQGVRLGANIALLAQRYEMLPHPVRFESLHRRHGPLTLAPQATASGAGDTLPSLIAQHRSLLRKIEMLIRQRPDGQRGEIILAEIARNHVEMASILATLINENAVRDTVPVPIVALHGTTPEPQDRDAD